MSKLACLNPIDLKDKEVLFRCRKCKTCQIVRRLEWQSRLLLEQYGCIYKPLFITNTYAVAPKNTRECLDEMQKFIKRIRRKYGETRYFMVTERGTQFKRLHNHLILWNDFLCNIPTIHSGIAVKERWGKGIVDVQKLKSIGGLKYVAKYITKNETNYQADEYSEYDPHTMLYKNKGRLYSWSNKPIMGHRGLTRWQYLAQKMIQQDYMPPRNFNAVILGAKTRVYIPSDYYAKYMLEYFKLDSSKTLLESEAWQNVINELETEEGLNQLNQDENYLELINKQLKMYR